MNKKHFAALLYLILSIGPSITYGQDEPLPFYYPDGTKYKGKAKNIGQINNELEERGRVYIVNPYTDNNDYLTSVGYKLFTDKPLWVLTDSPEKVKDAITKFDLHEFLTSWEFEMELEKYIKKNILTDIFILETLGQPTKRSKYFDANIEFENWTYNNLSLVLTLKKGFVISYIRQD